MKPKINFSFNFYRKFSGIFSVISLLTLSGCVDFSPSTLRGEYLGTLTLGGSSEPLPVTAKIIADNDTDALIQLKCTANASSSSNPSVCETTILLHKSGRTKGNLSIQGDSKLNFALAYEPTESTRDRPCLSSVGDSSEGNAEICISEDQILISFVDQKGSQNSFSLTRMLSETLNSPPEEHREYALSELLDRAAHYDFSTRAEYQRYLQARYTAKASLLAQIPHVNLGTIGNLLGGLNVPSIIAVVGDLLPFLLPNRWMQVKEAKLVSKAERLSDVIIRLNAISYTETLCYSYLRDFKLVEKLTEERTQISAIFKELQLREELGQLAAGSSQDIAAILNSVDQAILQVAETTEDELKDISQSVGFTFPETVRGIKMDLKRSIETPVRIDENVYLAESLKRAHEVEQAEFLFEASKIARVERYFSWLDPQAPPQLSIGVALFPAGKTAAAQVKEFSIIKEQIRAATLNRASSIYSTFEYSLNNQALILKANEIQTDRVKRILSQLELGTHFYLSELVSAVQDQVAASVNDIGNQALYRVSEARMDRMLLRGVYSKYDNTDF